MAPPLTGSSLIPHPPTEGYGSVKRILCSLLVATAPFGSVLADAPKSKNAKVTLVYQHELPNVPDKSIKGVLVEYGPGGYSPGHTHAKSGLSVGGAELSGSALFFFAISIGARRFPGFCTWEFDRHKPPLSFVARDPLVTAGKIPGRTSDGGSGCCL